jgi:hypothetical protein
MLLRFQLPRTFHLNFLFGSFRQPTFRKLDSPSKFSRFYLGITKRLLDTDELANHLRARSDPPHRWANRSSVSSYRLSAFPKFRLTRFAISLYKASLGEFSASKWLGDLLSHPRGISKIRCRSAHFSFGRFRIPRVLSHGRRDRN